MVQFGDKRPDKINASTWVVLHLKAATYKRCFIDMRLYKNFGEETEVDIFLKKVTVMFENKNAMNRVTVFKTIVTL